MTIPCGYCVRCESSLARLCFDTVRARWYIHCFECGSEREIDNPCDYRRPGHLPVFLPPGSVAHWRVAIAPSGSSHDAERSAPAARGLEAG